MRLILPIFVLSTLFFIFMYKVILMNNGYPVKWRRFGSDIFDELSWMRELAKKTEKRSLKIRYYLALSLFFINLLVFCVLAIIYF